MTDEQCLYICPSLSGLSIELAQLGAKMTCTRYSHLGELYLWWYKLGELCKAAEFCRLSLAPKQYRSTPLTALFQEKLRDYAL